MFHGTSQRAIDAIVADGFKIGGTEGVPIATAAAHGNGIYLSEEPDFAQRYIKGGGLCLLFAKCVPSTDSMRVPATGAIWFRKKV
jgi:hypothetical protein